MSKSKRVIKLKAKVRKLQTEQIGYQDTNKILDAALESTRAALMLSDDDNTVKNRVIRIRDAKIRSMEDQMTKNHEEFQRLLRDYKRSLELVNSLTTNIEVKQY